MKIIKYLTFLSVLSLLFLVFACGGSSQSEGETEANANESEENTEASNSEEGDAEDLRDEGYKRYALKSAHIEYEMSGVQNGTQSLYFDQWGMREAKFTKSSLEFAGVKQETDQIEILDGEFTYTIDLTRNTGIKGKNPIYQQIIAGADTKDLGELGIKILEGMGGKKVGEEEVLGKACDVWELSAAKSKMWVWKNIPLKIELQLPGMAYTATATSIDENASISEDKFEVPEGVDFQDLGEVLDQVDNL